MCKNMVLLIESFTIFFWLNVTDGGKKEIEFVVLILYQARIDTVNLDSNKEIVEKLFYKTPPFYNDHNENCFTILDATVIRPLASFFPPVYFYPM